MPLQIIGVDCATQPQKTGLARGYWDGNACVIDQICLGSNVPSRAETIATWMTDSAFSLLAIDAPLGWPAPMRDALPQHNAGDVLPLTPNGLFRRETDNVIKRELGKQPLDVGADRIARTAHVALRLLQDVRDLTRQSIPLGWKPGALRQSAAIEVYPAGTLLAHAIESSGYKRSDGEEARQSILDQLPATICLEGDNTLLLQNDDALDALLCILAGVDYLRGDVIRPKNLPLARREGWIWVKPRLQT
jgi:predicted nuclease with RNAse H fold